MTPGAWPDVAAVAAPARLMPMFDPHYPASARPATKPSRLLVLLAGLWAVFPASAAAAPADFAWLDPDNIVWTSPSRNTTSRRQTIILLNSDAPFCRVSMTTVLETRQRKTELRSGGFIPKWLPFLAQQISVLADRINDPN